MQEQGYTEDQVNEAKAPIADLLAEMNDQTVACYQQFVPMSQPVQYLAQICYASVPGWCCHARCFVPEWYYDNGYYVGPCFNAAYAGAWAVPVYSAYYNHGSHFYTRYHNVANTVHIHRSINVAQRHANWFRNHGDWKSFMAHDRLVHVTQNNLPPRFAASTQSYFSNRSYNPHAAAAHAGSNQHRPNGNPKPVAHNQVAKPHANHASTPRPAKAKHQASKPHANHASAHPPKMHHQQTPKAHANHAPAPHAHAQHPASHASHPNAAGHAQSHAAHPTQQKHH
jgi:hypothetical protein